jgi:tetratricopeptide (TPR) repeat protein
LGEYYLNVVVDTQQALVAYDAGVTRAPNNVDLLGGAAAAELGLGRWDAALQHFAKASALDPRSASAARRTGLTLAFLRRYPEAQAAVDRALALAPTNLDNIERKAMVALAQGDLAGARAVVRPALTTVEPAALLAFFGTYQDLYWVLGDGEQQQLLSLPPSEVAVRTVSVFILAQHLGPPPGSAHENPESKTSHAGPGAVGGPRLSHRGWGRDAGGRLLARPRRPSSPPPASGSQGAVRH